MGKPAVFPDPFGIPALSLPPAAAQNAARILTAKRRAGAYLCVRRAAPPANRGLEGGACKRGRGVQGNLTVQPARPALLRAGYKVGCAPGREPPSAQQHGGAGDHSQIGRKPSPKAAPFLKRHAALRDCGSSYAPAARVLGGQAQPVRRVARQRRGRGVQRDPGEPWVPPCPFGPCAEAHIPVPRPWREYPYAGSTPLMRTEGRRGIGINGDAGCRVT